MGETTNLEKLDEETKLAIAMVNARLKGAKFSIPDSAQQRAAAKRPKLWINRNTPPEKIHEIKELILDTLYGLFVGLERGEVLPIWMGLSFDDGTGEVKFSGRLQGPRP